MKQAKITVTMNGETESGRGTLRISEGRASLSYAFGGGSTEISFSAGEGVLSRKSEMAFSLPLGNQEPRTVLLQTAYGDIPATVRTKRFLSRITETSANLAVTYFLSDGYTEQEFSLSLSARYSTEEVC